MKTLSTFVHVSDLHIGQLDHATLDAVVPTTPPRWWAWSHWLDGLMGHSYHAIVHLERFMHSLKAERPKLVVTGDVTASGAPADFDTAMRLLSADLEPMEGLRIGLNQVDVRNRMIPGNHDHWPGDGSILGSEAPGFKSRFGAFPTLERITLPGHPAKLVLIRIDTDSAVRAWGPSRLLARGCFVDQLTDVQGKLHLGPADEHEVRILLLHHSQCYRHSGLTRPFGILEIDKATRRALDRFYFEHDIAVVLSGHVHLPDIRVHEVHTHPDDGSRKRTVAHLQCGTTLQRDEVPLPWRRVGASRFPPNSLFVHRIIDDRRRLKWRVEQYTRNATRGFHLTRQRTFAVWPRRHSLARRAPQA